jgi:hypothetical protein
MNEDLKYILDKVNDLLKFAETKHAGLVVFNSAFILGILSVYAAGPLFLQKSINYHRPLIFCVLV